MQYYQGQKDKCTVIFVKTLMAFSKENSKKKIKEDVVHLDLTQIIGGESWFTVIFGSIPLDFWTSIANFVKVSCQTNIDLSNSGTEQNPGICQNVVGDVLRRIAGKVIAKCSYQNKCKRYSQIISSICRSRSRIKSSHSCNIWRSTLRWYRSRPSTRRW